MFFRQRLRTAIVAVVLSALLAPSAAAAKKPKEPKPAIPRGARITGKVVGGPKGGAMAGAIVRVKFLESGEEWRSGPADRKGRYSIARLPYGYAELTVETPDGSYAGDHVIELSPRGDIGLDLSLRPMAALPAGFWNAESAAGAHGLASEKQNLRGRDFWTSPAGIAVIAGVGAAALLAIASGSKVRGN